MTNYSKEIEARQFVDIFKKSGSPKKLLKYFEASPVWPNETLEGHAKALRGLYDNREKYQRHHFLERDNINKIKLNRIKSLVFYAYNNIEFYKKHYLNVGFQPEDLKSLEDFKKLPSITKSDLHRSYVESMDKGPFQITYIWFFWFSSKLDK